MNNQNLVLDLYSFRQLVNECLDSSKTVLFYGMLELEPELDQNL